MARYIDAEKAVEVIVDTPSMVGSKYDFNHDVLTALVDREHEVIDLINNNVPTEDVAPVIHAHWKEFEDYSGAVYPECSRCGLVWWLEEGTAEDNEMYYCPKCGAKMDEE